MSENLKNLELSKILDLDKIRVVGNPIEKAHGLPNECYTSSDYLSIERERIFKDKWTVIGVGSSVPNVGDAPPYNLLGIPLIIRRDTEKKIRVFHKVCSH
jgi:choline monooxygenase